MPISTGLASRPTYDAAAILIRDKQLEAERELAYARMRAQRASQRSSQKAAAGRSLFDALKQRAAQGSAQRAAAGRDAANRAQRDKEQAAMIAQRRAEQEFRERQQNVRGLSALEQSLLKRQQAFQDKIAALQQKLGVDFTEKEQEELENLKKEWAEVARNVNDPGQRLQALHELMGRIETYNPTTRARTVQEEVNDPKNQWIDPNTGVTHIRDPRTGAMSQVAAPKTTPALEAEKLRLKAQAAADARSAREAERQDRLKIEAGKYNNELMIKSGKTEADAWKLTENVYPGAIKPPASVVDPPINQLRRDLPLVLRSYQNGEGGKSAAATPETKAAGERIERWLENAKRNPSSLSPDERSLQRDLQSLEDFHQFRHGNLLGAVYDKLNSAPRANAEAAIKRISGWLSNPQSSPSQSSNASPGRAAMMSRGQTSAAPSQFERHAFASEKLGFNDFLASPWRKMEPTLGDKEAYGRYESAFDNTRAKLPLVESESQLQSLNLPVGAPFRTPDGKVLQNHLPPVTSLPGGGGTPADAANAANPANATTNKPPPPTEPAKPPFRFQFPSHRPAMENPRAVDPGALKVWVIGNSEKETADLLRSIPKGAIPASSVGTFFLKEQTPEREAQVRKDFNVKELPLVVRTIGNREVARVEGAKSWADMKEMFKSTAQEAKEDEDKNKEIIARREESERQQSQAANDNAAERYSRAMEQGTMSATTPLSEAEFIKNHGDSSLPGKGFPAYQQAYDSARNAIETAEPNAKTIYQPLSKEMQRLADIKAEFDAKLAESQSFDPKKNPAKATRPEATPDKSLNAAATTIRDQLLKDDKFIKSIDHQMNLNKQIDKASLSKFTGFPVDSEAFRHAYNGAIAAAQDVAKFKKEQERNKAKQESLPKPTVSPSQGGMSPMKPSAFNFNPQYNPGAAQPLPQQMQRSRGLPPGINKLPVSRTSEGMAALNKQLSESAYQDFQQRKAAGLTGSQVFVDPYFGFNPLQSRRDQQQQQQQQFAMQQQQADMSTQWAGAVGPGSIYGGGFGGGYNPGGFGSGQFNNGGYGYDSFDFSSGGSTSYDSPSYDSGSGYGGYDSWGGGPSIPTDIYDYGGYAPGGDYGVPGGYGPGDYGSVGDFSSLG